MSARSLASAGIQQPNPVIGTPAQDILSSPDIQQDYPDTCAVKCQELIIEQFTGQSIPEDALVQEALQHGWYRPTQGTLPQDIGNLLELHGIAVNRYENANIFNLASELAQGHKVIIGLDSGELWSENPILEQIEDRFGIGGADHAVVVSGIDTTDPANVKVIISDPGTGEGAATYPLAQFLDAWRDSNFFMVATQQPAPAHLPEMVNFNYDTGFAPGVLPEQLMQYQSHPEDLVDFIHSLYPDNPMDQSYLPEMEHLHDPIVNPGPDVPVDSSSMSDLDQLEVEMAREEAQRHVDSGAFTDPYND